MATNEKILQATIKAQDMFTSTVKKVVENAKRVNETIKKLNENTANVTAKDKASAILENATKKLKAFGKMVVSPVIKVKDFAWNIIKKRIDGLKNFGKTIAIATVKVKDLALNTIKKSANKLKDFGKSIATATIKIKDLATSPINKAKGKLQAFSNSKFAQAVLNVKDKASGVIAKVMGKLKAFGQGSYNAVVKVKDMATGVLGSIGSKLTALAGGITIAVVAKVGFEGLAQEQTQKLTISRVVENTGATKEQAKKTTEEYYKYLEEFANKTPFTTAEVAQMGTKSMLISKGDVELAKKVTDAQANVKAFVGEDHIADCYRNVA